MQRYRTGAPTLASALGFLDTGATIVILPSMALTLDVPVDQLQGVVSFALLSLGLLVLPAGALVDRWGPARVGRVGLLLATIACLITATSTDPPTILASRALFGVGSGLFLPAALAQVRDPRSGGKALVHWTVAVSVVTLVAPALGATILALGQWQSLYVVEAVAAAVVAVLWASQNRSVAVRHAQPPVRWRGAIQVQVVTAFAYAGFSGIPFLLSISLQVTGGHHPLVVGAILCIDGALVAALTPFLGGTEGTSASRRRRITAGCLTCALAVPFLSAGLSRSEVLAFGMVGIGMAVLGVGSALFIAPLTAEALDALGPSRKGVAAGANLAIARLAAAAGVGVMSMASAPGLESGATTSNLLRGLAILGLLFLGAAVASLFGRHRPPTVPDDEQYDDTGDEDNAQS